MGRSIRINLESELLSASVLKQVRERDALPLSALIKDKLRDQKVADVWLFLFRAVFVLEEAEEAALR